jgi:hypothetical protein
MKTQLATAAACWLAGQLLRLPSRSDAPLHLRRRAAGWELGAVLDLALNSRELALGQRPQGAGLGHSDLLARGPLGSQLSAQLNLAVHSEVDDAQEAGGRAGGGLGADPQPAGWLSGPAGPLFVADRLPE